MEALFVAIMLLVLLLVVMMSLQPKWQRAARIKCLSNLKNAALSYKVLANDNDGKLPFATTNILAGGNDHTLWLHFQAMSNQLGSAKILVCAADRERVNNTKSDFSAGPLGLASAGNAAVSYGASLDADETRPNSILLLDRNLVTNTWNLRAKVVLAISNRPPEWDNRQHKLCGNVALADGSIQDVLNSGLADLVRLQGIATNRLLLPLLP